MLQNKHILFISSWYPNRNNPTHGIFNRYFAEAVSIYNKVSVLHVCSDDSLQTKFEMVETIENNINTTIIYYKKIHSALPFISQFLKRNKVIKAFNKGYQRIYKTVGKPDIIQLNVIMPAGIGVSYLSKKYNIPYVINENWTGYTPEDGNYKGFMLKFFTKKIVAAAQKIMPVSEDLKKAMLKHDLKGDYAIVPNVVNTNLFLPENIKKTTLIKFLHISSIDDEQKNVSGIIRAFTEANKINHLIELNIVGEGKDSVMLEQLVKKLGLENRVNFKGRLMKQDLVDEINANNALVMFSNYETFCLVIAEAFSCGKPVITSNAGGITDYMIPQLGIMMDKKDEKSLTLALLDFASDKYAYDSKFIRDFAVDHYSKEVVGRKLDELYKSVLQKI